MQQQYNKYVVLEILKMPLETAKHVELIQDHKVLELQEDAVQIHAMPILYCLWMVLVKLAQQGNSQMAVVELVPEEVALQDKLLDQMELVKTVQLILDHNLKVLHDQILHDQMLHEILTYPHKYVVQIPAKEIKFFFKLVIVRIVQ